MDLQSADHLRVGLPVSTLLFVAVSMWKQKVDQYGTSFPPVSPVLRSDSVTNRRLVLVFAGVLVLTVSLSVDFVATVRLVVVVESVCLLVSSALFPPLVNFDSLTRRL